MTGVYGKTLINMGTHSITLPPLYLLFLLHFLDLLLLLAANYTGKTGRSQSLSVPADDELNTVPECQLGGSGSGGQMDGPRFWDQRRPFIILLPEMQYFGTESCYTFCITNLDVSSGDCEGLTNLNKFQTLDWNVPIILNKKYQCVICDPLEETPVRRTLVPYATSAGEVIYYTSPSERQPQISTPHSTARRQSSAARQHWPRPHERKNSNVQNE